MELCLPPHQHMNRGKGWLPCGGHWLLVAGGLLLRFSVCAQEYPKLTHVISYEELQKKSIQRKVEWVNPDQTQEELIFTEMAVPIDEEMKKKTRQFVHEVYGLDSIYLNPRLIVFHAMGDGNLKTSLEVSSFLHNQIPESWGTLSKAGNLPNGAHFIIDRDGKIFCLSPPSSYEKENHRWLIKRHQDGNPVAIGIENVTPKENYTNLTAGQIESNAKLARWLISFEQQKIKFISSHHQFNDEAGYDRFLNFFVLKNFRKQYRTRQRLDIGNKNITTLLKKINQRGIVVRSFFDQ